MRLIKLVFVPRLTEFVLQETSALSLESVDCENPMATYLQILPVQLCIFVFFAKNSTIKNCLPNLPCVRRYGGRLLQIPFALLCWALGRCMF